MWGTGKKHRMRSPRGPSMEGGRQRCEKTSRGDRAFKKGNKGLTVVARGISEAKSTFLGEKKPGQVKGDWEKGPQLCCRPLRRQKEG